MPPPPEPREEKEVKPEPKVRRRTDTPLAAMLPSKYADVDVTNLFPDFRYDKVCLLTLYSVMVPNHSAT